MEECEGEVASSHEGRSPTKKKTFDGDKGSFPSRKLPPMPMSPNSLKALRRTSQRIRGESKLPIVVGEDVRIERQEISENENNMQLKVRR